MMVNSELAFTAVLLLPSPALNIGLSSHPRSPLRQAVQSHFTEEETEAVEVNLPQGSWPVLSRGRLGYVPSPF